MSADVPPRQPRAVLNRLSHRPPRPVNWEVLSEEEQEAWYLAHPEYPRPEAQA